MEQKTEKIRIRVTPEELEHLKKCSGSSSVVFKNGRDNFSGYLRSKLLLETSHKNQQIEQQMKELQYELRKIGTNVNQIAKKVNGGFGTPNDLVELKNYMNRIEKVMEELQKEVENIWQSPS